ncbi:FecR domain-containing protein [Luteimonas sp. XNQY3]|nr:FecR domain-containing protein [Luteimonas sp. XNQY3]MCD9005711.1 FecR domain-containing protein [Luteimonas sp. XNQY3]
MNKTDGMGGRRDRDIAAQAAEWVVSLADPGSSVGERRAFVAWLKRSPVHLEEYLRAEGAWAELGLLDPERRFDVDALLARPETNVVDLGVVGDGGRVASRTPFAMLAGVAAVAVAVLFSLGLFLMSSGPGDGYATAIGEQRTVRLADGSSVVLNTDTRLHVAFSGTAREVRLLAGEALFSVEKDAARPFRVASDGVVVQAVGTAFVVRRTPDRTIVSVLEGEVAVARARPAAVPAADAPDGALRLLAGQRADIAAHAARTRDIRNPEAVTAWRGGRLVFDGDTLAEVVAEFNRYNRVKLVLDDPVLSAERVSGVFDSDRPQALARFLEHAGVVETPRRADDRIVLVPRR